jgi:hypothetical protein
MAATPESFVDALDLAFGKQTTQRAAHAKGVVLLGKFVLSAVSPRWRLPRPHPQGCQGGRLASPTADSLRTDHQWKDRKSVGPDCTRCAPIAR